MCRIACDVGILERREWTGVERVAAGLVRELGKISEEEILLYSRRPIRWPFELPGSLVPRPLGGPRSIFLWRETSLAPALSRDGVSLLHSPVAAIPLGTRVARTATIHEMPWLAHPGIEGRIVELRHRLRILAAARAASALLVPTSTVAEDLFRLVPEASGKVHVAPFGVEASFRPLSGAGWQRELRRRFALPDGPLVLFVGKPRRKKNLDVLAEAVSLARTIMRRAPTLALAGTPRDGGVCPAGAIPLGFVSDVDLVRLYNLADVVAYPSISEGFGLPPLEAMACMTPVVAGNGGALPEVLEGAALLVDPADPAAIARAVGRAVEDPATRSRLVAAGRERARRFAWDRASRRALSIFESVAA